MATLIILTVLAAFGVLSALWALFGFLLPGQRGPVMVCLCRSGGKEEAVIRRYRWLRDLGLLHCPLILVDGGLTEEERVRLGKQDVEICTLAELDARLEQEREILG